jgi:hypothetical protein
VVDYMELAKRDLGEAAVLDAVARLIHGPSLSAGLDAGFLDEIPESPGVKWTPQSRQYQVEFKRVADHMQRNGAAPIRFLSEMFLAH